MISIPEANTRAASINYLTATCYKVSHEAGWWTAKDGTPLQDNPLIFSNKLMLIVSEAAEALEGDRKDTMDSHLPHRKTTEVELADLLIRVLDLAGAYGYDLGGAVVEKMAYNLTRVDHSVAARASTNGKRY